MVGAILGDIIGSRHEFNNIKTKDFELFTPDCDFTDDTVMTCAVAQALLEADDEGCWENLKKKTVEVMQRIGRQYPYCGFGGMFFNWMFTNNPKPYNSFGNGAAMRISPVPFFFKDDRAINVAHDVTSVSHNHPEGMKGAEAATVATLMALHGCSKEEIRRNIEDKYYISKYTVDEYRGIIRGHGEETCQVSMPEAFQCFYEGNSYEDVMRNCVSIGGGSDTLCAIAGGIAEAYYGIPDELKRMLPVYLDDQLMDIVERFEAKVGTPLNI